MNIRALLLGLIFVIIWSSAFTSARIIVLYSSPLAALSIRFFISGLIGVFIALALGQSLSLQSLNGGQLLFLVYVRTLFIWV